MHEIIAFLGPSWGFFRNRGVVCCRRSGTDPGGNIHGHLVCLVYLTFELCALIGKCFRQTLHHLGNEFVAVPDRLLRVIDKTVLTASHRERKSVATSGRKRGTSCSSLLP